MNHKTMVDLRTVDLTAYPDLVVIYLGMRVRTFAGIKTLLGLGPQIDKAGTQRPEGLLHCENNIIFKLYPLHLGMRWYWRDFESMERWTRSEPHVRWWSDFLRHSGGTGFWHEVYLMRGKMERRLLRHEQAADRLPRFCSSFAGARGHFFSSPAIANGRRDAAAAERIF